MGHSRFLPQPQGTLLIRPVGPVVGIEGLCVRPPPPALISKIKKTKLTSWSRALLEKLIVAQRVKMSALYGTRGISLESTNATYPDSNEFSPHPYTLFL